MTDMDYHWSPANQRRFLEHLADNGSVRLASRAVSMADASAYRLRRRKEGMAFAIGWDAALQIAGARLRSDLMDRALYGQRDVAIRRKEEEGERTKTTRKRKDNRLAMWMLGNIDARIAAQDDLAAALSRLVAQDFDAFLDLIEAGGDVTEIVEFIGDQLPQQRKQKNAHNYDLSQFCALFGVEEESRPGDDGHYLFQRYADDEWRSTFPPPPGFTGEENGEYGDDIYSRELTAEEMAELMADLATNAGEDEVVTATQNSHFAYTQDEDDDPGIEPCADDEELCLVIDEGENPSSPPMNRKMRRAAAALRAKADATMVLGKPH